MSYRKERLIKEIANNLAYSSKSTDLNNVMWLFDNNKIAEYFFAGLFSLVFGKLNTYDDEVSEWIRSLKSCCIISILIVILRTIL